MKKAVYKLKAGEAQGKMITKVMCLGVTPVEDNWVMYFSGGDDGRSIITQDKERIELLDRYLANTSNPFFYKVEA